MDEEHVLGTAWLGKYDQTRCSTEAVSGASYIVYISVLSRILPPALLK